MGQVGRKNARSWNLAKQEASRCNQNFAAKIEASKKKERGVNGNFILKSLSCIDNFLGCFSQDELKTLVVVKFPCFIIVNLDSSGMDGSHWIAIGIFQDVLEIYDPLGFDIFNWPVIPCTLLSFPHRMATTRRVKVIPRIQSDSSVLCGYYSMFYVFLRKFTDFKHTFSCFHLTHFLGNDDILCKFFK